MSDIILIVVLVLCVACVATGAALLSTAAGLIVFGLLGLAVLYVYLRGLARGAR